MEAVVLAAGKGERIKPFTGDKPKPLIKIVDKPLIDYVIESLVENKIEKIIFVVGYKKEDVISYIRLKSKRLGFRPEFVVQKKPLGTGDALKIAFSKLEGESFLTVYGDLYYDKRIIRNLLKKFGRDSRFNYIVLVKKKDVTQYGLVEVEGDQVKRVVEKPKKAESGLVNTGIYLFKGEVFESLCKVNMSERGEYELTDALNDLCKRGRLKYLEVSSKRWMDVGKPWDILDASFMELKKRTMSFYKYTKFKVKAPSYVSENTSIGDNCTIGPYSVLGKGVKVGEKSIISYSVIMDGAVVGSESKISYSLLGAGSKVGSRVRTKVLLRRKLQLQVSGRKLAINPRKIGALIGERVHIPDKKILHPAEVHVGLTR